jgi:hypothetical protein
MPTFSIPNRAVIPAFNAAVALQSWLRPGLLAYIVGSHVEALRPHAVRLFQERAVMLDGAVKKHPEGHELAGQAVVLPGPNGTELNPFSSPEAGAEFQQREAELMAATTTLVVDDRLTIAHIRALDTERLPTPRTMNNAPPTEQAVDFGALMVLVERPEYDADGVATSPSSNGASRAAALLP